MARYLSIIETAYRATIEEQDDTGLWFTHAMKNGGADVGVLLRGDAVNYAVKGQDASGLRFGTETLKVPPRLDKDIEALAAAAKIPVYVIEEDVSERGIDKAALVSGIEMISRSDAAKLLDNYDRIFHW